MFLACETYHVISYLLVPPLACIHATFYLFTFYFTWDEIIRTEKWHHLKLQNFYTARANNIEKKVLAKWEKIIASYLSKIRFANDQPQLGEGFWEKRFCDLWKQTTKSQILGPNSVPLEQLASHFLACFFSSLICFLWRSLVSTLCSARDLSLWSSLLLF